MNKPEENKIAPKHKPKNSKPTLPVIYFILALVVISVATVLFIWLINQTHKLRSITEQHQQIKTELNAQINALIQRQKQQAQTLQKTEQQIEQWIPHKPADKKYIKLNYLAQSLLFIEQNIHYNNTKTAIEQLDLIAEQQKNYLKTLGLTDSINRDRANLKRSHQRQQILYQLQQQINQLIRELFNPDAKNVSQVTEQLANPIAIASTEKAEQMHKSEQSLWYKLKNQIKTLWQMWLKHIKIEKRSEPSYADQQTIQTHKQIKQELDYLNRMAYLQLRLNAYASFDYVLDTMEQRLKSYGTFTSSTSSQRLIVRLNKLRAYKQRQQAQPPARLVSLAKVRAMLESGHTSGDH